MHKEHVVLKLYDDAAGVRPCELCGCRLEPQKMQAHVQRCPPARPEILPAFSFYFRCDWRCFEQSRCWQCVCTV